MEPSELLDPSELKAHILQAYEQVMALTDMQNFLPLAGLVLLAGNVLATRKLMGGAVGMDTGRDVVGFALVMAVYAALLGYLHFTFCRPVYLPASASIAAIFWLVAYAFVLYRLIYLPGRALARWQLVAPYKKIWFLALEGMIEVCRSERRFPLDGPYHDGASAADNQTMREDMNPCLAHDRTRWSAGFAVRREDIAFRSTATPRQLEEYSRCLDEFRRLGPGLFAPWPRLPDMIVPPRAEKGAALHFWRGYEGDGLANNQDALAHAAWRAGRAAAVWAGRELQPLQLQPLTTPAAA